MSLLKDHTFNVFKRFMINVLKCGPIPRHIGVIMDGNRRYAKKMNAENIVGHSKGFLKLMQSFYWTRQLGIEEVTFYAFSIENFQRTPQEVTELLDLATLKFQQLLEEIDILMDEGICIRIIGDVTLLKRKDLTKVMYELTLLTKHNTNFFLNIAFAYTSREEITAAVKSVVEGVQNKDIHLDDVTVDLLTKCLYTNTNPDLLIRTSGETRLSDFLLWQISDSVIDFMDILWPDFSAWTFFLCLLKYQKSYYSKQYKSYGTSSDDIDETKRDRIEKFVSNLKEKRYDVLESTTL